MKKGGNMLQKISARIKQLMHSAWWGRWGSLVSMLIQTHNIRSGKRQVTLITNKHLILRHNLKHPTDCIMPHSLSNFQHQLKSLHSTCHWLYSRLYSFSIQRTEGPHWTSHWGEALGLKFQMGQAWGGTLSLLLRISKRLPWPLLLISGE